MAVVCVPETVGRDLVQPVPDGVALVVWDGRGEPPAGLGQVEFWVPTYMSRDPAERDRAIAAMPALQVIQLLSAGAEVWVGAVPQGVTLCDGRGIHGGSTSEWVLAAVLAVLRQIPRFAAAQRDHRWDPAITDELADKRVLIIGAGDVGQNVGRRVEAFDAQPTLVGRNPRPGIHGVAELPVLLPHADVVIVVVPLTPDTTHLVDTRFLAAMPDGALFVNASRGRVVDTDALLVELERGRLRAALDVVDPEPLPPDHRIWDAPNLLITPHVGGSVRGFPPRAYRLVREQIERYVLGEPLDNVVREGY